MKETTIKINLHSDQDVEEWSKLSKVQQKVINKSLEQADAGLGNSLKDVTKQLHKKHGI